MPDIQPPRIPTPTGGASLMIAFQCKKKNILVVGTSTIAANRVLSALEADACVTVVGSKETMCTELLYRIQHTQIAWRETFEPKCLEGQDLAFVCLSEPATCRTIAHHCRVQRVPVNVTDMNDLCDFFMTSTYRDQSLQIAVSTNGQASKLSNRIRRHVVGSLPPRLGDAVQRMGVLRKKVRTSDPSSAASGRRMQWLAQIAEYWSMDRLAQLSDRDMEELLEAYHNDEGYESTDGGLNRLAPLAMPLARGSTLSTGSIALVGCGLGDPNLLTLAAHKAIQEADLVLSDKIVPAEVIALVKCELKIARKFPGNANAAQDEFNELALRALKEGKKVLRLKQGDPFLFGRGGEEVLFFRKHGYTPSVIPGISSSAAASLLAGIPLTHRAVASQFLVTTGTGANNTSPHLPVYDEHRTDVFLMSIHRLAALTKDLLEHQKYPVDLPCAIVERASCADQRVVWGTLSNIVDVLESVGGSRPPGLLIVGRAIEVLKHEDHPAVGVASTLMTASGARVDDVQTNLLQLHDPEGVC
ncbi:hypothetical protein DFQ28_000752 [Apophysomyces sp. BC1034]|nr:hypothetical protein DFQ30_002159 [Apophysomyces sp. BC1015]KAG0182130.1 hypothetical protein DFQ29_005629 [Apophysomyces sp. BC1021]KAG0191205.1 hypothetical protein DFQ28_000752 [Apophysomyces sp. BC1034]